jgi:hypothetical protein
MSLYGRQPAVLPASSLSTTQYDANLPENVNFKGYKFTNTPIKNQNVINQNLKRLSNSGPKSISIYLTIFALLFPFGLWLINSKSLKDENEIINNKSSDHSPAEQPMADVISIGEKNKDSEDVDSEKQKKAS